jgi:hypothetical protein
MVANAVYARQDGGVGKVIRDKGRRGEVEGEGGNCGKGVIVYVQRK